MRTTPLNTYRVTFHYTVDVEAVHEDDADVLAVSEMERQINEYRDHIVRDMVATRELIDGTEPGQDD